MIKETIKNRKNQRVVALIEESQNSKGLVFVMHGLSGNKEELHIQAIAEAFKEQDYSVIRFDTTNTFGESEGQFEDATVTNYYEDLEDVIEWSRKQKWYKEPFVLAGHSLGSICILLFAEKFQSKVKALAPISTVISGKLSLETKSHSQDIEEWKRGGVLVWKGHSGRIKRLKWSHMEDRLRYDVLKDINKIKVPVLLIVGEKDESTPVKHQKILYDALKCEKEFHIIKESEHTFKESKELTELKSLFEYWIKKLNSN